LTRRFGLKDWGLKGLGREAFQGCPEDRCYAFHPHMSLRHRPHEKSDAILVHSVDLMYLPPLRNYQRDPRQLWVYYTIESQRYSLCSLVYSIHDLDGLFNLTVTFKPQNDIVVDYRDFRDWNQVHLIEAYVENYRQAVLKDENFFKNQILSTFELFANKLIIINYSILIYFVLKNF